ncbi:hypothetical protein M8C21_020323 [Ambrosia artemisiifolia]|uniref:Uncharacterized protein n=1 Tax=Ambrosia artemisiifolia TaxID=4212 RepID=A0AAD5CBF1_AMBAR|nr:hypothetical protein M8C21_020323 [Ambrosia artemisiifolia]
MAGIGLLMDLLRKNPTLNGQNLHSTGLYSAASSAAVTPFALFGFSGKRFAYCDAGATPSLSAEDYLTSLRTASETIFRHDTLNYGTKQYSIELKPLFSAFQPRSFALTSLRSFLLFYLPILVPKVEDDDDDFLPDSSDEHHVDLVVPLKKSVKQIIRETSVVTTRRVLERLAVHHFSQRAAWKLLKDVPKSAMRKANRGMPIYTYFFCVSRTTFRGHFLGVAASWLVQVGIECYRFVRDITKSNEGEDVDVNVDQSERAKVLGKKMCGATVRCGASLVFASIGAGIGATLFRPSSGQSIGCLLGDMAGPIIVTFCFANVSHLEL